MPCCSLLLLDSAPRYRNDGDAYGDAVHHGKLVLGRIAVWEGRIAEAKALLLMAGRTPGSPALNSFGPNMSLAEDLLKLGERDVVLEYFGECRIFWRSGRARLDTWSAEVLAGTIPDFGANLRY